MDLTNAVAQNAVLLHKSGLPINTQRRDTALLLAWQLDHDLEPDGIYDRATEESLNTYLLTLEDPPEVQPDEETEAENPVVTRSANFAVFDGPVDRQPRNTAELYKLLGHPEPKGSDWERREIRDLRGLDERKTKDGEPGYTGVHRIVAPYAVEGIARVRSTGYRIKRCGGWKYRHMRNNPKMALSRHASGAALDLNSNANFSRTFGIDEDGPEPFTAAWAAIWDSPDAITLEAVRAMESCGWKWGGWWKAPRGKRGFRDPMHFEWVGGLPV